MPLSARCRKPAGPAGVGGRAKERMASRSVHSWSRRAALDNVLRQVDGKEAGIDASAPSKDWAEWFEQIKKVKAAGKFVMPDQTQVFNSVASTYSIVDPHEEWGIHFGAKKTKINPETYAKALQLFGDMKPLPLRRQPQRRGDQGPVHHQSACLPRGRPLGRSDLPPGGAGFWAEVRLRVGAGREAGPVRRGV